MSKKVKKDKFIAQAGILAMAGIVSRIIGLLYRSPLTAIIGDEGIGYYAAAYNIYTIVLLISSYSIPSAISKLIAQKLARKQYIDAHRIFRSALYYVLIVGIIAALFLYFASEFLVEGPAINVLKVFAPTILIYGILGVLRGYFQAHKSMLQTSISQISEQILNCVISIGSAVLLISLAMSSLERYELTELNEVMLGDQIVSQAEIVLDESGEIIGYALSDEQKEWNTNRAMYGAIGSAIGTGVGVVTALIFMGFMYYINRDYFYKRQQRDYFSEKKSYGALLKNVFFTITPFILSTALYNISTALNQTIFTKFMIYIKGEDTTEVATQYGVFSGKAVVIANIPIALSSAMSAAVIPSIASAIANNNYNLVREKIALSIQTILLIAIPAAVGIGVLAKPITWILYPQKESIDLASSLLMLLAISIIFYSLSTLTNGILQGIGKINLPVWHSAMALLIQTLLLGALLFSTPLGLYSMAIVNIVYSFIICILNQRSLRKLVKFKLKWKKTILVPSLAALIMGFLSWATYEGIYGLCEITIISLVAAVMCGVVTYFYFIIKLKGINKEELLELPKGYLLVKIAEKIRLM